jgi:hypothetical protein
MKYLKLLLGIFYKFLKNIINLINKPYATYRKLAIEGNIFNLILIFIFIALYFFLVSPIKTHSLHPFIITLKTYRLFTVTFFSYVMVCIFLYVLGKLMSHQVSFKSIAICWGFSLVPTLFWFFATSFFYVFLPPPRQATFLGHLFSVVFVAFSIALLFWKAILYYLTLRFALRFDLLKILGVSLIFVPALFAYSVWLYFLGIFKVPFL